LGIFSAVTLPGFIDVDGPEVPRIHLQLELAKAAAR
jgi:hypothetical protein